MIRRLIILLISCSTLLAACNGPNRHSNKLRVGYLPIAECLPLYVAKEKGYFEKYGLDIELISASGGPVIFKEIEAGSLDIGFSNVVSLLKQNNSGKEYLSIFGGSYETVSNINHAMFGLKDVNFETASKMKFGINARNNIEELMLLSFLRKKDIKINDEILKNIIETPFPQMLTELRSKSINIACVVEPSIAIAKSKPDEFTYIGNHYNQDSVDKILVATYVAKKDFTIKRKDALENFIKAMKDAVNEINSTTDNSRGVILRYSKIDSNLLGKISLPMFSSEIKPQDLSYIMTLMYDSVFNQNRLFMPNPNNKMNPDSLIY